MDATPTTYLDHASAAQPSITQLNGISEDLRNLKLSNPHSNHPNAAATRAMIASVRNRILTFFRTTSDHYDVVFTSGATDSLRTIAQCFDFNCQKVTKQLLKSFPDRRVGGHFVYMQDAHTSVTGMRELIRQRCRAICVIDYEDFEKNLITPTGTSAEGTDDNTNDLFVITAMSNFCGRKYPLEIIDRIRQWRPGHSFTCLDAASWVASSVLDLSRYQPDFVALSFYKVCRIWIGIETFLSELKIVSRNLIKFPINSIAILKRKNRSNSTILISIFGYPTGIGALLIRTGSARLLQKSYFGGGTIKLVLPTGDQVFRKDKSFDRFEDGTINYWGISALERGFQDLDNCGGMETIEKSAYDLACKAFEMLQTIKYHNGTSIARVYCSADAYSDRRIQGPIVTFNLLNPDGSYIGYNEVEKMCDLMSIELRTGCFCNQGACQKYLNLTDEQLLINYQEYGKECGDQTGLIDGTPVGAIRISFGRQSTIQDLNKLRTMLETCFLSVQLAQPTVKSGGQENTLISGTLLNIFIYPIKSCAPIIANSWQIISTGLKYDRTWLIARSDGEALSQKRNQRLCLVQPKIDGNLLELTAKYEDQPQQSMKIPLDYCHQGVHSVDTPIIQSSTTCCSRESKTIDCGNSVAGWLNIVLHENDCRLVRQQNMETSNLSSTAPFLLINRASVAYLAKIVDRPVDDIQRRFRANFVVDGMDAFVEDKLTSLAIGDIEFDVLKASIRCQIICVDQETGKKEPDLLLALRNFRMVNNKKIAFGIYIKHKPQYNGRVIKVGDKFKAKIAD